MEIQCGPILFSSKFDSGNLRHVEQVDLNADDEVEKSYLDPHPHDYEFNVWTSPDAAGTENENGNRTWFYFSVKGNLCYKTVKFNIMNMNKQSKLYSQGMSPVYRVVPSKNVKWLRVREKPTYQVVDDQFNMSFVHKFIDTKFATYFAFCYPFSYHENQQMLCNLKKEYNSDNYKCPSDIYFHCDTLCHSNDGLNVDLLTVTSMKNITSSREDTLPHLYPDKSVQRAHVFKDKKVFFLSSRVHPGETPASFVFNGFLKFILRKEDHRAAALRDTFVFKMVPILNPDGVKRGHYRTDSLGKNLNRVYSNPDRSRHPSIYAVKSYIAYLSSFETTSNTVLLSAESTHTKKNSVSSISLSKPNCKLKDKKQVSSSHSNILLKDGSSGKAQEILEEKHNSNFIEKISDSTMAMMTKIDERNELCTDENSNLVTSSSTPAATKKPLFAYFEQSLAISDDEDDDDADSSDQNTTLDKPVGGGASKIEMRRNNGVHLYVDLHGHASKRGCFIYGNYYDHEVEQMQCMLFPKLIACNTAHFDFQACNFSEKNMYHRDKRDGQSKEGSGRVAIAKAFGIIHSYTLECNYNSGRSTNCISYASGDDGRCTPPPNPGFPPRYTIDHYEEVGRAMAVAALDLYDINPWSRLPLSEYRSLLGVQDCLYKYIHTSPKCALSLTSKKRGKSSTKSRWLSPASFTKTSVTKIDTCLKSPKVTSSSHHHQNTSNLPNVVPSTNTKVYYQKYENRNRSKSVPQNTSSKTERNALLERTMIRYQQGKVLNMSKIDAGMFQDSKQNLAPLIGGGGGGGGAQHHDHAENVLSSRDTFEKKEAKETSNYLNRKNISPRLPNKKAQVPTIVNISSNNRFANAIVESSLKKEGTAATKKHFPSHCNGYIKPIRLPSKKSLSTARL